ncbi:MAG: hypothetical protein LBJ63_01385 [Prevotellaceae bacterium]|jgi:hypothetical protein|nr:hypothetical protein [Prevotellaceae bacterium]
MNTQKRLSELFKEWQKECEKTDEYGTYFAPDGIIHDVQEYERMPKKVLFLLKEPHGHPGDIFSWIWNKKELYQGQLFKNLAYWLYGLLHVENGKTIPFDKLNLEAVVEFAVKTPFAFVNAKKHFGGAVCDDGKLQEYILQYEEFLAKEIEILNPHIIVCCGTPQNEFVYRLFKDKDNTIDKENVLQYDKATKRVSIYSYHPSARSSYEEMYSNMMVQYEKFLAKYPD